MNSIIQKALCLSLFAFLFLAHPTIAQSLPVHAYFFYSDGCPHCAKERQFLFGELSREYPNLKIYEYEVSNNETNASRLLKTAQTLGVSVDGVPFLVIGDKRFVGYANGISSERIEQRMQECSSKECPDSVASIVGVNVTNARMDGLQKNNAITQPAARNNDDQNSDGVHATDVQGKNSEKIVHIPLLGDVNVMSFSLPLLTAVLGILDGFNPCAMWTLLFLISLLLGMENKRRMWILGSAFIVASASVYFLFMSAWLNLILFLGFVVWIRTLIGILAFAGGGYNLKEFIFNKTGGCKVAGDETRQKVFGQLQKTVQQNSFWLALGGIVILAFMVNLIELICSAGLPAVYTQVLALNKMDGWQYHLYILLYILFFMLDDLFVFFIAMITLEMTGITTKYARISRLVGGIVMLIIGIALIFKPSLLMFG